MAISPLMQRVIAGAAIVPASALSLPIAATFLDAPGRENWIFPAQIAGAGMLGASVGAMLPHAFTKTGNVGRAAMLGAGAALGVAALADVALFTLIAG